MKRILLLLGSLLLPLPICCQDSGTGKLTLKWVAANRVLDGVEVRLKNADKMAEIKQIVFDCGKAETGICIVPNVPPGRWNVQLFPYNAGNPPSIHTYGEPFIKSIEVTIAQPPLIPAAGSVSVQ